jgi:glycosyltransferase involved in cell wall biosynthesis
VVAVIPAFDEETTIGAVVEGALRHCSKVLVINDCSKDKTEQEARKAGAIVVSHTLRVGPGGALETGFKAALLIGADVIVTLDADGQHDPSEIPTLVDHVASGNGSVVIGSRFLRSRRNMPLEKRFGNLVLSKITSWACGQTVTDALCGFRAYSRETIPRIRNLPPDYSWGSDIILQLASNGFSIKEVPITTLYDEARPGRGMGIGDAVKLLVHILRWKLVNSSLI